MDSISAVVKKKRKWNGYIIVTGPVAPYEGNCFCEMQFYNKELQKLFSSFNVQQVDSNRSFDVRICVEVSPVVILTLLESKGFYIVGCGFTGMEGNLCWTLKKYTKYRVLSLLFKSSMLANSLVFNEYFVILLAIALCYISYLLN